MLTFPDVKFVHLLLKCLKITQYTPFCYHIYSLWISSPQASQEEASYEETRPAIHTDAKLTPHTKLFNISTSHLQSMTINKPVLILSAFCF